MREDIKKRLKQVQAGGMPFGYQQSFGISPVDWKASKLKNLCKKRAEKNTDFSISAVFSNTAAYGVIRQQEYFEKDIANFENINTYFVVHEKDFIYNPRISVLAPYGPIHSNELGEPGIVSPLYTVFSLENAKQASYEYMKYYFSSSRWHSYMYSIANYGARHDRMNITDKDFFDLPIFLPKLNEQQKIAEILNHCNKVIELKQKLIEEERNRKKWLLQNLFDPDSDFRSVNWLCTWTQSKLLGLCISICDGDWIESKDQSEAGIRLIQTGNIGVNNYIDKGERARYISQNTFDYLNCTEVINGDVLLSRLPDPIGRACMIENLKEKAITAVDCSILKFHNNITAKYFLQYASTNVYFKQIAILAGGSTRTRISRKEIENLTIPIPDSLDVQEDIVNALSTIDNNITLLEKELAQWQQKKKSLMQLLLTGLVRVTV